MYTRVADRKSGKRYGHPSVLDTCLYTGVSTLSRRRRRRRLRRSIGKKTARLLSSKHGRFLYTAGNRDTL